MCTIKEKRTERCRLECDFRFYPFQLSCPLSLVSSYLDCIRQPLQEEQKRADSDIAMSVDFAVLSLNDQVKNVSWLINVTFKQEDSKL